MSTVRYKLTLRERFHAWLLARRDAKKYVDPHVEKAHISTSINSLIDRRYSTIMQINEEFHSQVQGHAATLNQVNLSTKPSENNEVGHAGREWHAYLEAKAAGTNSAEAVVQLREQFLSRVNAHIYSADALLSIYVSTVKRHHPRKDLLVDWSPTLPPISQQLIFLHPSLEKLVEMNLTEQGRP